MVFDVAILGGGPGGYVAAIKAAQLGLKVLLIEREKLGGVCLNRGCIPTKTLLKCSETFKSMKDSERYGIYAEKVRLDFGKMMARKDEVVKTLISGIESLVRSNGIEFVKGEGRIINPGTVRVGSTDYSARNIIIATGSRSVVPNIEGIHDSCVLDSDAVLSMKSLPSSVSIIGGGVIGVELGIMLSELGCSVNIIEMLDEILSNFDCDIVQKAKRMLVNNKIGVFTGARVTKIDSGRVTFEMDGKTQTIQSERVLIATGRVPNTEKSELDRLGIKHNNGRIETNDRMQTNVSGIYAIGDVNGKFMLAHVASAEGIVAAGNIAGQDLKMNYSAVPQCVYTHPEIACVGMTEKEAKEKGYTVKIGRFPLSANGKSVSEGKTDGMVKIISDDSTGEILGVHMMCSHATEMISESVLAMNLEATVKEIAGTIHPHPTVSEAIMEAALAADGRPIHIVRRG